ncbi:MAG: holo-ACP synthase AcpS [Marmoricola sp.]
MTGVGVDLVHVPTFAEQLALPGSRFRSVFSVGERADAVARSLESAQEAAFWAARWAAREAAVKAWSATLFGEEPPYGDEVLAQIEVACDAWGRPRLIFRGDVAEALAGHEPALSLSHDGDYAIAYVVLSD